MIITKSKPFTKDEIEKLQEEYKTYIKTVIDIDRKTCCAGMNMHVDGEQLLLQNDSQQSSVWGGGFDTMTKEITYNSFINVRPQDGNRSNFIEKEAIRKAYGKLTEYFFKEIL